MSVRILVTDVYEKPVVNATIRVKWGDGLSEHTTNSAGIADTGLKGKVLWVSVYGKEISFGAYYTDETLPVQI